MKNRFFYTKWKELSYSSKKCIKKPKEEGKNLSNSQMEYMKK